MAILIKNITSNNKNSKFVYFVTLNNIRFTKYKSEICYLLYFNLYYNHN